MPSKELKIHNVWEQLDEAAREMNLRGLSEIRVVTEIVHTLTRQDLKRGGFPTSASSVRLEWDENAETE